MILTLTVEHVAHDVSVYCDVLGLFIFCLVVADSSSVQLKTVGMALASKFITRDLCPGRNKNKLYINHEQPTLMINYKIACCKNNMYMLQSSLELPLISITLNF